MNKKTISIIGIILLALLVGALVFLYLRKGPQGDSVLSGILPFGTPGDQSVDFGSEYRQEEYRADAPQIVSGTIELGKIRRISEAPVSGATSLFIGTTSMVRYVDKATGHIFEVDLEKGKRERITNTTIPKAGEVVWGSGGSTLIYRFLEDNLIQGTLLSLRKATTSSDELYETKEAPLPINLLELVASPTQDNFFGIVPTFEGSAGKLINSNGISENTSFSHPLKSWLIEWPESSLIAFTSKASSDSEGFLFSYNLSTKKFDLLLSGKGLLTHWGNTSKKVVYSLSTRNTTTLHAYDVASKKSTFLGISTLAPKCTWKSSDVLICAIPQGGVPVGSPDSWYQGLVSLSDDLWSIDTTTGETIQIANLSSVAEKGIDATQLFLSADGSFVIFTNKKDGILWAVEI
jgi:hypothetical protein